MNNSINDEDLEPSKPSSENWLRSKILINKKII